MASNIGDIRAKVAGDANQRGRLQDRAGELTSADLDIAIGAAVSEYAKHRPRRRVVKLSGAGSFDFAIANLPELVSIGQVEEVVAPYVATTQRLEPLDSAAYELRWLDTGLVFRLLTVTPATGTFVLVTYTTPHTLDAVTSTVNAEDDEALADLSTAFALEALANRFSQSVSGTLSADSVDHLSKADQYRQDAAQWRASWKRKMGLDSTAVAASGTVVELDGVMSDPYRTSFFFHGRRGE